MNQLIHRVSGLRAIPLLVAVLVLLAGCQTPRFLQAELPDDGPAIAVSQAAALRFMEKLQTAGQQATQSQSVSLTVSEQEVTSFLSIGSQLSQQLEAMNVDSVAQLEQLQGSPQLAQFEGLGDWLQFLRGGEGLPNLSLSELGLSLQEPQVHFRGDGQIVIRGYAQALGQKQPLRLVLAPRASEGELVLDFVEGKLGPVSVPEGIIDQIGLGLSRLILAGQDYVRVSQIRVSDGALTVSGAYRR